MARLIIAVLTLLSIIGAWYWLSPARQIVLDRPVLVPLPTIAVEAASPAPVRWVQIAEKFRPDQPTAMLAGLLHHFENGMSLPYPTAADRVRTELLGHFLDSRVLPNFRSASSWLYRDGEGRLRTSVRTDEASESHPSQVLATLAARGIPADRIIHSGTTTATVAELVLALRDDFHLDGEVEWKAIALARYAPTRRSWKNRWGRTYDFDRIAYDLLGRPLDHGSCCGTHVLQALAMLLRVDSVRPILTDRMRAAIRDHLKTMASRLNQGQRPEGCWAPDWATPHPNPTDYRDDPIFFKAEELALVTGHHLEWLDLVQPEIDIAPRARFAALAWCARTSERVTEATVRENICAYSHCFRVASRGLPPAFWTEMEESR